MTGAPARAAREATARDARAVLAQVVDPEIPVISIEDLGILRDVTVDEAGVVQVTITPTYSGCPAMDTIRADVEAALAGAGHPGVRVRTVLSPAWTTDWMTEEGRRALDEAGIAPPAARASAAPVLVGLSVRCPQCGSLDTRLLSRFGSTACKALYRCDACLEPFDHFKAI
ncbi:MAG: 1,2-phenylacetyl-CoA epoxidase subunit PaaD [Actinomycetes bacterium]